MESYLFDRSQDTGSAEFQSGQALIKTLKHRFQTYGFRQVRTSTFEQYDLYDLVSGTVKRENMIKAIDQSGKVMVMRPDVTIPITRMMASSTTREARLFYVSHIFRQYPEASELEERLQAGVERFGSDRPETDAEVITLAAHGLQDLGFERFKIEMGHAGFFKAVMRQLDLAPAEREQLQMLVQSKNLADIKRFLADVNVPDDLAAILQTIPLLYGDPEDVLKRAEELALTPDMKAELADLHALNKLLQAYDAADAVVFDLGLINNMDYYSGVIFQGVVADYGKPVVMGGRYDRLADQFGAVLPAIGFAYETSYLADALRQENRLVSTAPSVDITLFYEPQEQINALRTANDLREAGYAVVTYPRGDSGHTAEDSSCTACFSPDGNWFDDQQTEQAFTDGQELQSLLHEAIGGA
ncbi:ATP phosphoribosyltransferase regulatory subunit [Barrientosiimonas marina]|uniref:ATP phosphoribosyltransferase regulatory subunit n=1 Tax=Lentibacillus kimchii TaxID=1542911 RepID=A0ABW2UZ16_9BACI